MNRYLVLTEDGKYVGPVKRGVFFVTTPDLAKAFLFTKKETKKLMDIGKSFGFRNLKIAPDAHKETL